MRLRSRGPSLILAWWTSLLSPLPRYLHWLFLNIQRASCHIIAPTSWSLPASSFFIFAETPFPILRSDTLIPSGVVRITCNLGGLPIIYSLIHLFHCPLCFSHSRLPAQSPLTFSSQLEHGASPAPPGALQPLHFLTTWRWKNTSSLGAGTRPRHLMGGTPPCACVLGGGAVPTFRAKFALPRVGEGCWGGGGVLRESRAPVTGGGRAGSGTRAGDPAWGTRSPGGAGISVDQDWEAPRGLPRNRARIPGSPGRKHNFSAASGRLGLLRNGSWAMPYLLERLRTGRWSPGSRLWNSVFTVCSFL